MTPHSPPPSPMVRETRPATPPKQNRWPGQTGLLTVSINVSVTVAKPPTSGPYASNNSAIQVSIVAPATPLLSKMFIGNFNVGGGSVALVGASAATGCVLALNGAAAGAGTLSGTTNITLSNCSFVVNSNSSSALVMNGNAALTAANVVLGGGDSISNNSTLTTTGGVLMNQAAGRGSLLRPHDSDGYRDLSYHRQKDTDVVTRPLLQRLGLYRRRHHAQPRRLRPRRHRPQPYGRSNLEGTGGVTIVLTSAGAASTIGNIDIKGGATVNIKAPTTAQNAQTAGIAFWIDKRASDNGNSFNGGSTMNITGAIYLPSQSVTFNGGNSTGGAVCTQLIANEITFTGNSGFQNNCAGLGTSAITPTSSLATLAQ